MSVARVLDALKPHRAEALQRVRTNTFFLVLLVVLSYLLPLPTVPSAFSHALLLAPRASESIGFGRTIISSRVSKYACRLPFSRVHTVHPAPAGTWWPGRYEAEPIFAVVGRFDGLFHVHAVPCKSYAGCCGLERETYGRRDWKAVGRLVFGSDLCRGSG